MDEQKNKDLHGAVDTITEKNVFVVLDEGGTVRVDPKSFPLLARAKRDRRVVVRRRNGHAQNFDGGPNADLVRTLS